MCHNVQNVCNKILFLFVYHIFIYSRCTQIVRDGKPRVESSSSALLYVDSRTWCFVTDCHQFPDPSSFPYRPFHWDQLASEAVAVIKLDILKVKLWSAKHLPRQFKCATLPQSMWLMMAM